MGLFDKLKNAAPGAITNAVKNAATSKNETVTFQSVPDTFEAFTALPQAQLANEFDTVAMTVVALCNYPDNKDLSIQMLNYLRGPRPLSNQEIQFLKDRFSDQDYVPRSYFVGATPDNDYLPAEPYQIKMFTNQYSRDGGEGYVKVWLNSGGADSPRYCVVRKAKDGKYYLWEQGILVGIRQPESANPWA
jgi:hypothetical protein